MRRRSITLAVVAWAALPLAGCGGPITPGELSRSIQTLESTAAEGSLLAKDVAEDRSKATFVRVHSRDLSDVVQHEAEKLSDAEASRADVAPAKTDAIDLADRIDSEHAVIFSIPVLSPTYLPILLVGNDREVMGAHVNGPLARAFGWVYFVLICVLALAAPVHRDERRRLVACG